MLNEKWESIVILPTFRDKNEFFIITVRYFFVGGNETHDSDNDFVTTNGFFNFGHSNFSDPSGDFQVQSLAFLVEFD